MLNLNQVHQILKETKTFVDNIYTLDIIAVGQFYKGWLYGDLSKVHEIDLCDSNEIQEQVPHSWYKYPDGAKGFHPWDGITDPDFDISSAKGISHKIEELDESASYCWIN